MTILAGASDSFKSELFQAIHDFTADTFKIALYDSSAEMTPQITAYTTTNEVTGTGYSAGGATLTGIARYSSAGVAWVDWNDPSWTGADFTARCALIYNSSKANRAVVVLDFGSDRVFTSTNNSIQFPAGDRDTAILRLGAARG